MLPVEPCPSGQMAVVGETSCRAVADCGDGRWGAIPVESDTIYVDEAAVGLAVGTADEPFVTIGAALAVVRPGGMIAVAAGNYAESLFVATPVRLWGRCPQMVSIDGDGVGAGLFIQVADVEVHTLALAPTSFGLYAEAPNVELDRIWVHDTPDAGIALVSPASVVIRDSLIERASGLGVAAIGADVRIERSVIRELLANIDAPGRAVSVERRMTTGVAASLVVADSVLRGALESGVAVLSSTATIESSVITNTMPQADGRYGVGVAVQGTSAAPAFAAIADSYIHQSHTAAVSVLEATATLTGVTIDQVLPQPSNDGFGDGVMVLGSAVAASVEVTRSRIAGAARAGLANFDATAVLDGVAFECNTIHLDGERLNGDYTFDVRGGNACWCGNLDDTCKVLTSSLAPPSL